MTELNLSKVAPEIAVLLIMRGTATPPLSWSQSPCQAACDKLESLSNPDLLGGNVIKNKPLVDSLKALLFLRNGWLIECHQLAQMLPEEPRLYLSALVERQQGNAEKAKSNFQSMNGHPIYKEMASRAIKQYKATAGEHVGRFLAILEMNGDWEPYAFCDLITSASEGNLSDIEKQVVCELQFDEFNWLFAYCYKDVTGNNVTLAETEPVRGELAA